MYSGRAGLLAVLLIIAVLMTENSPVFAAMSWSATSVTVIQGASGSSTVTFAGADVEGGYACVPPLPDGVLCSYASTGNTIAGTFSLFILPSVTDTITVTTSSSTPIGSYTITLHIISCTDLVCAGDISFTLTVGVLVIEVPYSICVIRLGIEQSDGALLWLLGYAYPGTPISQCQDKTEVLGQDVLDRTIVIHQFILNGTSYKIVTIQPPAIIQ